MEPSSPHWRHLRQFLRTNTLERYVLTYYDVTHTTHHWREHLQVRVHEPGTAPWNGLVASAEEIQKPGPIYGKPTAPENRIVTALLVRPGWDPTLPRPDPVATPRPDPVSVPIACAEPIGWFE